MAGRHEGVAIGIMSLALAPAAGILNDEDAGADPDSSEERREALGNREYKASRLSGTVHCGKRGIEALKDWDWGPGIHEMAGLMHVSTLLIAVVENAIGEVDDEVTGHAHVDGCLFSVRFVRFASKPLSIFIQTSQVEIGSVNANALTVFELIKLRPTVFYEGICLHNGKKLQLGKKWFKICECFNHVQRRDRQLCSDAGRDVDGDESKERGARRE
ncbi:hypothetical protein B0H17DRAFT_1138486 [Mycena rosella]|uniref:Uncharacterized protein n=1 Tax=Mycena rosella TaxID=1033263 RepID=A0AAD7D6H7_MYCRO|nr:hypothetical protein B0H17DRAFT_1138486 [Mycena rosella]